MSQDGLIRGFLECLLKTQISFKAVQVTHHLKGQGQRGFPHLMEVTLVEAVRVLVEAAAVGGKLN